MTKPTLLIRADANVAIGTGHVMRCLALAQAWQDSGGRCVFFMVESTPSITRRLQEQGIEVEFLGSAGGTTEDAKLTVDLGRKQNAEWIVVDGYQFDSAYQSAIKAAGCKVLFMDDNVHAAPYCADLVLNQNLQARPDLYAHRDSSTQLLLGPGYAMLRREFRNRRNWRREHPTIARKILITMGGSDPDNLTARAMEAVQSLSDAGLEIVVLAGGSNPHLPSLQRLIRQNSSARLIVDTPDVSEWMAWADIAISGAGTTFWEMCFLGLPSLLLVLAPNQEGVAAAAEKLQIACSLGEHSGVSASAIAGKLRVLLDSAEARAAQSHNGRKLVDGRGAERVVAFLSGLELRPTVHSDCELYWEWANDADARAASFRNKTISWDHHAQWFKAKMEDPQAVLFTAWNRSGNPVGQVRYHKDGNRAVISINLGATFRGQGWGQKILTLATEKFFREYEVDFVDAFVKPTNEASLKLFDNAGFLRLSPATIEGQQGVHFVLERSAAWRGISQRKKSERGISEIKAIAGKTTA